MRIRDMQREVHELAVSKGWWPEDEGARQSPINEILAKLALVHSEISEAVECVREGQLPLICNPYNSAKPEGMVVELADAVIRIADLCDALGLDLEYAIEMKHAYNQARPHRHGGKLA